MTVVAPMGEGRSLDEGEFFNGFGPARPLGTKGEMEGGSMTWAGRNRVLESTLTGEMIVSFLQESQAAYTSKTFLKDSIIFWESEPHPYQYFLVEGTVELSTTDSAGRKKCIDFYGPGSFVGFQILREDNMPMTTARVLRACRALAIPRDSFYKMLHTIPEFADISMSYLFGLLTMQTKEVTVASFYTAPQRIALLLIDLINEQAAHKASPEGPIVLPYTNNDIADILGISRNSVSTALSRFQKQGILEKHRNNIEIVDSEKIAAVVQFEQL